MADAIPGCGVIGLKRRPALHHIQPIRMQPVVGQPDSCGLKANQRRGRS